MRELRQQQRSAPRTNPTAAHANIGKDEVAECISWLGAEGLWDRFCRFHRAAALFLLPASGFLAVGVVACFSVTWSLAFGAVLFAYPHLLFKGEKGGVHKSQTLIREFAHWSRALFEYFPIKVSVVGRLDHRKRYLYAYHPHGCYAMGLFSLVFPEHSELHHHPARPDVVVGVANSLLCLPFVGRFVARLGFVPASPATLLKVFRETHYSIALVPGGIPEMLEYDRSQNDEVVYLSRRKGFVKLAIETGMPIVPMYGFGENDIFVRYSWLKRTRLFLSRRFRITIQLFRGRWFTLLPFRTPIHVVIGNPIEVPQARNPSEDLVDRVHAQYKSALIELFNAHKTECGYGDRRLVLI